MARTSRFPLTATICTAIAVVILCGLGWWQVERLQWKNQMLAALDREYARDADKVRLDTSDINAVAGGDIMLRRGSITGRYLHEYEMQLRASYNKGRAGIDIVTPFKLKDSDTVMFVNRGWLPKERSEPGQSPKIRARGTMRITGTLRRPDGHIIGTPENKPEQGKWYHIAPAQMAKAKRLPKLAPVVFKVTSQPLPVAGQYPETRRERPRPHNRHLYYAVFWFAMAGVLLLMYYLRFIRQERA